MNHFTHIDKNGTVKMVDVSDKDITKRTAVAKSEIYMSKDTLDLILSDKIAKGNVLETAKLTGISAVKKTWDLIFLCHPLKITGIDFDFVIDKNSSCIAFYCTVNAEDRTGVEMEALTGAVAACLAVYDMCKAYDKKMIINNAVLLKKRGGKSDLNLISENSDLKETCS
ncbi:MAG: cyclic pyranopterin monophosphate synthase MoaC [Desulfobacteraceae bacterium]|nr:cyclic pyranopterin monophosphate synthase MoaC [Desulfobacteraceae bacterium]